MEHFNFEKHTCRQFDDVKGLMGFFNAHKAIVWSWAARGWTVDKDHKVLRLRVSGHHHKGYVWITVNGSDLFDIYFTNLKGEIKKEAKDVYLDMLIDTIDVHVERIAAYVR